MVTSHDVTLISCMSMVYGLVGSVQVEGFLFYGGLLPVAFSGYMTSFQRLCALRSVVTKPAVMAAVTATTAASIVELYARQVLYVARHHPSGKPLSSRTDHTPDVRAFALSFDGLMD